MFFAIKLRASRMSSVVRGMSRDVKTRSQPVDVGQGGVIAIAVRALVARIAAVPRGLAESCLLPNDDGCPWSIPGCNPWAELPSAAETDVRHTRDRRNCDD